MEDHLSCTKCNKHQKIKFSNTITQTYIHQFNYNLL